MHGHTQIHIPRTYTHLIVSPSIASLQRVHSARILGGAVGLRGEVVDLEIVLVGHGRRRLLVCGILAPRGPPRAVDAHGAPSALCSRALAMDVNTRQDQERSCREWIQCPCSVC